MLSEILLKLTSTRAGAWLGARTLHRIDRLVLRLTGGRHSASSLLTETPIISLTTIGARSGRPRTVPLIGVPNDRGIILIATNWGGPHHPAWYHNLRANPEALVSANGQSGSYRARLAEGAEWEGCWQKALAVYPGYAAYRKRTERPIGVFVLEPAASEND